MDGLVNLGLRKCVLATSCLLHCMPRQPDPSKDSLDRFEIVERCNHEAAKVAVPT